LPEKGAKEVVLSEPKIRVIKFRSPQSQTFSPIWKLLLGKNVKKRTQEARGRRTPGGGEGEGVVQEVKTGMGLKVLNTEGVNQRREPWGGVVGGHFLSEWGTKTVPREGACLRGKNSE